MLLLLFAPLLFFFFDLLYFISYQKRINQLIRLPFELISLIVYPCLFYLTIYGLPHIDVTSNYIAFTNHTTLFIILSIIFIPCVIAYFISDSTDSKSSGLRQGILSLLLIIAIIYDVILFIVISYYLHFIIAIIGNLPLLLMYGMNLIINLKKDIPSK